MAARIVVRMPTVLSLVAAALLIVLVSPARGDNPTLPRGSFPLLCVPPLGDPLVQCPLPPSGPPPPATGKPIYGPVVTSTSVRFDPRRIVVRFRSGTTRNAIDGVLTKAAVGLERVIPKAGVYVVRAGEGKAESAVAQLRRVRTVDHVEREVIVDGLDTNPNDPDWADQWGLRTAGFPKAWDVSRGTKRIVVAVVDTGVDKTHPDLRGAIVAGRDIVNNDDDPNDDNGHGTAVAGILAARGNNGVGLAGACWTCSVMPVKVLGADGTGTTANVAAGIIWAADHGAQVINLSLGSPGTTDALTGALAYAASKDVVVVAAAGNSGTTTPFYPAADSSVLSVAATNQDDHLYSWSNHGVWIQVAAPGCNSSPWKGGGYASFCGTSAAAPLVAGLAALVRSTSPQATAQQTVEAVNKAVDVVSAEVRHGRINAALAVSEAVHPALTATRRAATLRGRLSSKVRSQTHQQRVGAGRLVLDLTFSGAHRLSVSLVQAGQPEVRAAGKSPLRLTQVVTDGMLQIVVHGDGRKASYRLRLNFGAPVS